MWEKMIGFFEKLAEVRILVAVLFLALGAVCLLTGTTNLSAKFGITVTDQVGRYVLIAVGSISTFFAAVFSYPVLFESSLGRKKIRNIRPHIEVLRKKLAHEKFSPDLIIGLSRGGLVVAASLSDSIGNTPIISLWPHSYPEENGDNTDRFDNSLNSFDLLKISRAHITGQSSDKKSWDALIVDDACKSGKSLRDAKRFVERQLRGIEYRIRTAALEIETGLFKEYEPDFYVSVKVVSRDVYDDPELPDA